MLEPPDSPQPPIAQPAVGCRQCRRPLSWESISDRNFGERWIAVCSCGEIHSFHPDRRHPDEQPAEPLLMALQGHCAPRRPATPPWLRVFLASLQPPQPVHWRHHSQPCPNCESAARLGLLAWLDNETACQCSLCLACGYTVSQRQHLGGGALEPPLEGASWAPADLAVRRLRRCIFGNPLLLDPPSHA